MGSLGVQVEGPKARDVRVTRDSLVVELSDGRTVSAPLSWYPRLMHGTPAEREHWRLVGNGEGVHWPELDEDLSIESMIAGRPSGESNASLKQWLEARARRRESHRLYVPAMAAAADSSSHVEKRRRKKR